VHEANSGAESRGCDSGGLKLNTSASLRFRFYRGLMRLFSFLVLNRLRLRRVEGLARLLDFHDKNGEICPSSQGSLSQGSLKENADAENDRAGLSRAMKCTVWLHGASLGELESLWGLAERLSSGGFSLVLTCSSPSGLPGIKKLSEEICANGFRSSILFSGLAPIEGSWCEALARFKSRLFVTVKYEAWPELWGSLSEGKVPLLLIGARKRSSLQIVRTLLKALGMELPQLFFALVREEEKEPLEILFGSSPVFRVTGDPRWDRVQQRQRTKHARLEVVLEKLGALDKPWGVLGNIWASDFRVLEEALQSPFQGTLWFVPHDVSTTSLDQIETRLSALATHHQIDWIRTSSLRKESGSSLKIGQQALDKSLVRMVLVDEMGFLSELYRHAAWAYVGGGFQAGVHSAIEPAMSLIPIAIGPKRALSFSEVHLLADSGQLSICSSTGEVTDWYTRIKKEKNPIILEEQRRRWSLRIDSQMDATHRLADWVYEILQDGIQK
jgi:3-deoxy-D-manno-octulosonic-acid transferase